VSKKIVIIEEALIGRLDLLCNVYYGNNDESIADKIIDLNPRIDFFNTGLRLGDEVEIPTRLELLDEL